MAYKRIPRVCLRCAQAFPARAPAQRFCSKRCARFSQQSLAEHFAGRVQGCAHGPSCQVCCWPWTGWRDGLGYGVFEYHEKYYKANRVAYMVALELEELPTKQEVCHSCDNPPCCNPAHLWLGTHQENMQDASRKGRLLNRPRGEQHPKTTLTTQDVMAIRALRAQGWTYCAIHTLFPTSSLTTIGNIGREQTRKRG
jgi:hypothetical protein